MRTGLVLSAIIAVYSAPAYLGAQRGPWITTDIGVQYLRQTAPKEFGGQWLESSVTPSLGLALSLPLVSWFIPEAAVHTTVGLAFPWRSASLGVGTYWRRLRGARIRLAVTRIVKSEPVYCDWDVCSGPNSVPERRWGYEASFSVNLWMYHHAGLGPVLWYSSSREKPTFARERYQTFGLGVRLSYH